MQMRTTQRQAIGKLVDRYPPMSTLQRRLRPLLVSQPLFFGFRTTFFVGRFELRVAESVGQR